MYRSKRRQRWTRCRDSLRRVVQRHTERNVAHVMHCLQWGKKNSLQFGVTLTSFYQLASPAEAGLRQLKSSRSFKPDYEVPPLQMILIKAIHIFAERISRDFLCPIHKASGVWHRTGGCSSFNRRLEAVAWTETPGGWSSPVCGSRSKVIGQ